MTIEDKINNIRLYLYESTDRDKKIFEYLLDLIQDLKSEIDELNESIHF